VSLSHAQRSIPTGRVVFRGAGESYGDAAAQHAPDVLIGDDCESIGGEGEITYPQIRPDIWTGITSIIVPEFGGVDDLPDSLRELAGYRRP
jgi:hypothetical protein